MQLTIVSTFFPIPQDRGDPVRVLMMLRAISRVRPFTLLVVRRPTTTEAQLSQLRELLPGVEVRDYAATAYRLDRLGPFGRYQEAFIEGMPPWIRTRYSRDLHHDLRRRSGEGLAIGEAAGAYFPGTHLRWHWDKANVLAASTRQDIAEAGHLPHRLRARYLAKISTQFESRALSRARTVSVTSVEEAARLVDFYNRQADGILPSCVPVPAGHCPRAEDRRLVWLSSFSYRSNLLGLHRFLRDCWAQLHGAGFTLTLIGSGLTDTIKKDLHAYGGLEVLGYVHDLRPVLARARAGIVPIWSGAGIKLKTLTLLAHSLPVFTTPIGAEGVPPSSALRIAGTAESLANEILRTSPAELDAMAASAYCLIQQEFSEERFSRNLVKMLADNDYLENDGIDSCGSP